MLFQKELEARAIMSIKELAASSLQNLTKLLKELGHLELLLKNESEVSDVKKKELKFFAPIYFKLKIRIRLILIMLFLIFVLHVHTLLHS